MAAILILDYPVVNYSVRTFVTNFFSNNLVLHARSLEEARMHTALNEISFIVVNVHVSGALDADFTKILEKINRAIRILVFIDVDNSQYVDIYFDPE